MRAHQTNCTTSAMVTIGREHMQKLEEPNLLDHLVGTGEEGWWSANTKLLRSLEIYHQLKRGRLFYREISGLRAA